MHSWSSTYIYYENWNLLRNSVVVNAKTPSSQFVCLSVNYIQKWDILQNFQTLSIFLTANLNKKCISMFWLAKKYVQLLWYTNEFPRSLRSVVSMDYSSYDPHKMSLQWPVESFNKTTNVTEKRRKKKKKKF